MDAQSPTPILQDRLREMAWMAPATARLPGIQPLAVDDWMRQDEAFAGQMAERDRLITTCPELVHGLLPDARPAAEELLAEVLRILSTTQGYAVEAASVIRPDGIRVALNPEEPLLTLGRLVQEDFVIHLPQEGEHGFRAAILCFPASWTLSEKLGRPLTAVHRPVDVYDAGLAARVQRLFDAIRVEQPLWRANALLYEDPSLFHPLREGEKRPRPLSRNYLRTERQCLFRLPKSQAVVFSIHTTIVHVDNVPPDALEAFKALHP